MKKITIIAVIAIVLLSINWKGSGEDLTEFAQCLTDYGAEMYGTYWCSHCKAQKADFGSAFEFVNYIECTEEKALCTEKGVDGYPTWIIDGKSYAGKQPLGKLAALTDCELPR